MNFWLKLKLKFRISNSMNKKFNYMHDLEIQVYKIKKKKFQMNKKNSVEILK